MIEKRNLAADLARCEAVRALGHPVTSWWKYDFVDGRLRDMDDGYGDETVLATIELENGDDTILGDFFAESRTGWPHAIRRAIAGEQLLRDIAPFAHRLPPALEAMVREATREINSTTPPAFAATAVAAAAAGSNRR